ncbi:MAG: M23 family metallopeptidase [candidate division FCPU426 bacterium]
MNKTWKKLAGLAGLGLILLLQGGCTSSEQSAMPTEPGVMSAQAGKISLPDPGMTFPYQNPVQVDRFYCFGLFPWDTAGVETHGGTDIVPRYLPAFRRVQKVPLVAVANGRVARIVQSTTGAGCPSITVILQLNQFWFAIYTIEPQTLIPAEFERQVKAVRVKEGSRLRRGQKLADLLVATVKPGSYPHLHFGFIYKNPADSWEYIQTHYLEIARSDGTNLPPTSGPGSPWQPTDLGLPTTLYCPYVYFNSAARLVVDSRPKIAANGDECSSLCAYGSTGGNCGCAVAK